MSLFDGQGSDISPLVIVMDKIGIKGINHLINATVAVAVISNGLSCVYAGSRTLTALAETGYVPSIFACIDKAGRPPGTGGHPRFLSDCPCQLCRCEICRVRLACGAFWSVHTHRMVVNCVTHIRFRKAWRVQGHSIEEIPFRAFGGGYGPWLGVILIVIILIAQFYIVSCFFPHQ